MKAIKMSKDELLSIVKINKDKHIAEYLESVEDYKNLVVQISQANLKTSKTADLEQFKKLKSYPTAPQTYEDSYKRAIRMLELSVEDSVHIDEDVFNQLVLDEWTWKRRFSESNALYKSSM